MRNRRSTNCMSFQSVWSIRTGSKVFSVLLAADYLLSAPALALAGFSIEISVDAGPAVTYLDNGPEDLNLALLPVSMLP